MTCLVLGEKVMEPRGHFWNRQGAHGVWQLADGSPGGLGDPEIWIDDAAMDMYGRGDAAPGVTVTRPGGPDYGSTAGNWWAGASIRFARHGNDLSEPVVYQVISRCWSQENDGRPYYVCIRPE